MDNWTLIENLTLSSPYINIIVNGIQTLVAKNGDGRSFSLVVLEKDISDMSSHPDLDSHKVPSVIPGGIVIGRFTLTETGTAADESCYFRNEQRVEEHMVLSISTFLTLVDNYQRWSSFEQFLQSESSAGSDNPTPDNQVPFQYWWLVGELKPGMPVRDTLLYDGMGVFIRPEDNLLPVFTSSLYADMAGRCYSRQHGVELVPCQIFCPTCFLTGISALFGNRILRGGLLNEQWKIHFYTGAALEFTAPDLFRIQDSDGTDYDLTGCSDTGNLPLWVKGKHSGDEKFSGTQDKYVPWWTGNHN